MVNRPFPLSDAPRSGLTTRIDQIARTEWRAGWPVLLASLVGVGTTWILFQLIAGLFIVPMQHDLGWSRTELSLGSWSGFGAALLLPVAGLLIDRAGARWVAIGGMLTLAAGYAMLALMPPNRMVFYAITVWMSVAGATSNSVVFARGLATWFERGFGTSVGIMMAGPSIAASAVIPIISSIIFYQGWRAGYAAMSCLVLLVGLPVILGCFRQRAPDTTQDPCSRVITVSYRELLGHGPLVWLMLATAAAALPIGGFLGHLQPIMLEFGLTRSRAAQYGSAFAIAIGVGRLILGPLLDRFHAPTVTSASLALASFGAVALWLGNATIVGGTLIIAVAMIGLAQGAEADYLKFFAARLFGVALFGRIAGLLSMIASAGMAVGGLLFAAIHDRTGSYDAVFPTSVALYAIGAFCFARIRMSPFVCSEQKL